MLSMQNKREKEKERERFYHLSKEIKYVNLIGKKEENLETDSFI